LHPLILVISLSGSVERQEKVRAQLDQTDLPWQFLEAVRGTALIEPPKEYNAVKVRRLLCFELTPNEIGCFLSHKKAWQRCVEAHTPTLIFEDDFALLPHFKKTIAYLMAHPHTWQAVRLQGLFPVAQEVISDHGDFRIVINRGDAVGATAYLIQPAIAKRLIEASSDLYEPLDHFLEHERKHGIAFVAIDPYPVDITGVTSTIADRPGRTPITGFRKVLRSCYRAWDRLTHSDPWFPK
jgi:glycosyl transferase family 25